MRILIFILSLWTVSTTVSAGKPIIIDPSITATPPGVTVAAGYFTLVNESDDTITITDIYSTTISRVEMHQTVINDDVASMVKQNAVSVEAGDTLKFERGSYHIMLMELSEPLSPGDVVEVVLTTNAGEFLIDMPVQKHDMADGDMGHSDMDHSDMKHDETQHDDMNHKTTEGSLGMEHEAEKTDSMNGLNEMKDDAMNEIKDMKHDSDMPKMKTKNVN